MGKIVAKVEAFIDIDVEKLINAVSKEYETPIEDISMDDIFDYVSNGISYMESRGAKGVYVVCDGPSIEGFTEKTYDEIERILTEMQED